MSVAPGATVRPQNLRARVISEATEFAIAFSPDGREASHSPRRRSRQLSDVLLSEAQRRDMVRDGAVASQLKDGILRSFVTAEAAAVLFVEPARTAGAASGFDLVRGPHG